MHQTGQCVHNGGLEASKKWQILVSITPRKAGKHAVHFVKGSSRLWTAGKGRSGVVGHRGQVLATGTGLHSDIPDTQNFPVRRASYKVAEARKATPPSPTPERDLGCRLGLYELTGIFNKTLCIGSSQLQRPLNWTLSV